MTKKIFVAFFLFLLGMSFLSAQSLAEASKKEKERRAALKGKQTVVTNADLGKTKKKAAMTESVPEMPAEELEGAAPPDGEQAPAEEAFVEGAEGAAPPGETPPAAVETPPEAAPPAAQGAPPLSVEEFSQRKTELEDTWNKAQEMVELLTMKMNGLWQEFYSLDDMTARDKIQQQISETYEKLLKAQQDETKAREELDTFIARTPRENVPQIWIR
jgi:hypothetical protein